VTALRTEFFARLHRAKAGRVRTLFQAFGFMLFPKHTSVSFAQDGNESVPITTARSMRLQGDNAQVRVRYPVHVPDAALLKNSER
jgi:hypothetical protein